MQRAYLLVAGILTGAGVGLITGDVARWLAAGAVMGLVLAAAARRRPKQSITPPSLKADS